MCKLEKPDNLKEVILEGGDWGKEGNEVKEDGEREGRGKMLWLENSNERTVLLCKLEKPDNLKEVTQEGGNWGKEGDKER